MGNDLHLTNGFVEAETALYYYKKYDESECLNDLDFMQAQIDIINNINFNEIDINSKIETVNSSNCHFENKILFKKALLFTNNNFGQQKDLLNLPFHLKWKNVAKGNKPNGQPALKFGIQNNNLTKANQFPQISSIVNNKIRVSCKPTIQFLT